jgi:hypothetical protein
MATNRKSPAKEICIYCGDSVAFGAAAPELLRHLESLVEMAHCVTANWENGDLATAVRGLERIATEAKATILNAYGKNT